MPQGVDLANGIGIEVRIIKRARAVAQCIRHLVQITGFRPVVVPGCLH